MSLRTGPVRFAFAAAAASLVLLLSGCFSIPGGGGPTSSPTAEDVDPELARYYGQTLAWSDCGNGMECATATAPLDWSNPSPETDIELAVVRQPATGDPGQRLGSLFTNPGGPGASGADFVYDSVDFATSEDLQEAFDIVGWDPRGVGRSSAVSCYDDPADLDEFIYGLPEAPRGTDAWVEEITQASIDFAQACLDHSGELLQFIDTQSTVHDLDMLRAVVGDEKLNYLGYSYGSDIG